MSSAKSHRSNRYRDPMNLDPSRALAWRLEQHALEPVAATTVIDVAERVVALRGWPADLADFSIRVRQSKPEVNGLDRALAAGNLIRSYAFRGGSYVFTHENAAALLACRTATRVWETKRYQQQGQFTLDDWQPLREAVREVLSDGPATRERIGAHLSGIPSLRHLAVAATGAGSDSLYKPLHWWGDICFGPSEGAQATFRRLDDDPRWPGLPDIDVAGRRAITLYLRGYGPATFENLGYWLTEGLSVPRRRFGAWLADLGDAVTAVDIGGVTAYVLTEHLEAMSEAEPSRTVRLLPGFDPWLFGPGTADGRLVAPERRALATKGANLVIRGGVVSGTWRVQGDALTVTWFAEAGPAPVADLEGEVRRLGGMYSKELQLTMAAD